MIAKAFIQYIDGVRTFENRKSDEIWIEWEKRGMITPEMRKNIKLVRTYLKKFCYEIEENLNEQELKKLSRQLMKFDYRLIDDYTLKKLLRDIDDHMKYAVIERDKFIDIMEDIAEVRCVGCTSDYKTCPVHKVLDDMNVPYSGEEPNCPYAANLSKISDDKKKRVKELRKKLHSKNQFYRE